MLAVFETHPIQYHAPVWRAVARLGVPLHVCYGGNFSLKGYYDREFGKEFAWESDLLEGYECTLLPEVHTVWPKDYETVSSEGIGKWLDFSKPTAVIASGYAHPFDRAVLIKTISRKIPLFYRGEANDSSRKRSVFKTFVRRMILRQLYLRVDSCLYIGEEARSHYLKYGMPSDRLLFSPYCVDTSPFNLNEEARLKFRGETRKAFCIKDNDTVILFSGKLSHRKGVDLLVRAAHKLSRSDLVLLFVGDGDLMDSLKRITGPTRIVFAGFQNQSQLSRFYHAADLLALPSRHSETWGLVVNEAMHHGLPVVVSDTVGSRLDLIEIGRTGEVAKAGDFHALATALKACFEYAKCPETAQAVKEKIKPYSVCSAAKGVQEAWLNLTQNLDNSTAD